MPFRGGHLKEASLGTVGAALRRAREASGMTLHMVEVASAGRFKASTVAGYERGERAISVARLVELAAIYGTPPERLMAKLLAALDRQSDE